MNKKSREVAICLQYKKRLAYVTFLYALLAALVNKINVFVTCFRDIFSPLTKYELLYSIEMYIILRYWYLTFDLSNAESVHFIT
jgi:hypothetical protein